ncbi:WhiB family transcriptional regulator [Streptoverticillium reticulum]|uniref:WhiB family transcriptional regulator n=1 Tax=Streptoverticillium reticulum TaxID=1433415 RepID=UPI0039BED666
MKKRINLPILAAEFNVQALDWQSDAVCSQTDPDIFFPVRGQSSEPAKEACAGCPVREPCLDYALTNRETHGIWGGTAEHERRALRRAARSRPDQGPGRKVG